MRSKPPAKTPGLVFFGRLNTGLPRLTTNVPSFSHFNLLTAAQLQTTSPYFSFFFLIIFLLKWPDEQDDEGKTGEHEMKRRSEGMRDVV